MGAFEQDGLGGLIDLGFGASHDTGQSDGLTGVGNDEHVLIEFGWGLVEGEDLLAGLSASDDDPVFVEPVDVKRVQGLTHFHQDIVGDVNHVADGPLADGFESFLHPVGRFSDLDLFDHPGGIPCAEVGLIVLDGGDVVDGFGGFGKIDVGQFEGR